jgi:DNA-binding transcriptional LysR family regulator
MTRYPDLMLCAKKRKWGINRRIFWTLRALNGSAQRRCSGDHAGIERDLQTDDYYVNLIDEGAELAIRMGQFEDSALRACGIGPFERALLSVPAMNAGIGEAQARSNRFGSGANIGTSKHE